MRVITIVLKSSAHTCLELINALEQLQNQIYPSQISNFNPSGVLKFILSNGIYIYLQSQLYFKNCCIGAFENKREKSIVAMNIFTLTREMHQLLVSFFFCCFLVVQMHDNYTCKQKFCPSHPACLRSKISKQQQNAVCVNAAVLFYATCATRENRSICISFPCFFVK